MRPINEKRAAVLALLQNKRYHNAVKLIDKMQIGDITTRYLKVQLLKSLDANGEKDRTANLHKKWLKPRRKYVK